jgi:hypothetical protein
MPGLNQPTMLLIEREVRMLGETGILALITHPPGRFGNPAPLGVTLMGSEVTNRIVSFQGGPSRVGKPLLSHLAECLRLNCGLRDAVSGKRLSTDSPAIRN